MITVDHAKKLCIEVHKGQWCKLELFPANETYNLPNYQEFSTLGYFVTDEGITNEGNRISYDANLGWCKQLPYHTHPIAVTEMMTTDEEKIVALLHDVIKDTNYKCTAHISGNVAYIVTKPYGELLEESRVTIPIWRRLHLLPHTKGMPYMEYLTEVATDTVATKIKIADMFHNMSSNQSPTQKAKYLEGLKFLLSTL